jgi:hypothetical protein
MVSAACGDKQDPLEIGLRRVALDLAFKDETKAEPVSPRQVVTQLQVVDAGLAEEVPEEAEPPRRGPKLIVVPGRKPEPPCVPAPPGAQYDVPTYAVVKDPPAVGTYTRHNTGTVKIETAAFNLDLPYPAKSNVDISDIRYVTASSYVNSGDADSLGLPGEVRNSRDVFPPRVEFTMTRSGPSGSKIVDTFRYSLGGTSGGDFLWLIRRQSVVSGIKTDFNPTPPIRYVKLFVTEGTDSEVTHAGVDRATNTALTVQSKIVGRESVDVCGTVVDTFRVQIQENFADLSKQPPVISGNENGTANFWNIQFDHGLLVVREEVHSTYRGTADIAGAPVPVTVLYDYTSTLDALEPKAPKTATAVPTAPGGGDEPADEEGE